MTTTLKEEGIAEVLAEFAGRDVDVMLLDRDGQPQLGFWGRLTGASPVDEAGADVALEFAQIGGEAQVGGVVLSHEAPAEWRDVMVRVDHSGETTPVRGLVIDLGDGREVALCPL